MKKFLIIAFMALVFSTGFAPKEADAYVGVGINLGFGNGGYYGGRYDPYYGGYGYGSYGYPYGGYGSYGYPYGGYGYPYNRYSRYYTAPYSGPYFDTYYGGYYGGLR